MNAPITYLALSNATPAQLGVDPHSAADPPIRQKRQLPATRGFVADAISIPQ